MGYAAQVVYVESPLVQRARELKVQTMALRKVYSELRKDTMEQFVPVHENAETKLAYDLCVEELKLRFNKGLL